MQNSKTIILRCLALFAILGVTFYLVKAFDNRSSKQLPEPDWFVFSHEGLDAGDNFGRSVAIEGDFIAIGAVGDDGADNSGHDRGAVYLYQLVDNTFELQGTIGDGYDYDIPLGDDDYFGISVAIGEGRLLVGARGDDGYGVDLPNPDHHGAKGAVYVFNLETLALEGIIGDGYDVHVDLENDAFGWDVDIFGKHLAIAAVFDDGRNNDVYDAGAVYLYTLNETLSSAKLVHIYGTGYDIDVSLDPEDAYAHAVHIEDDTLLIGADKDDGKNNTGTNFGALYVYNLKTGQQTIMGMGYEEDVTLDDNDFFGLVSEIDGTCLISGSSGDDGADNAISGRGAVMVFDRKTLKPLGKIGSGYAIDIPLNQFDYASYFVAMSDDRILSGAPYGESEGRSPESDSGEIYLIRNACAYLQSLEISP